MATPGAFRWPPGRPDRPDRPEAPEPRRPEAPEATRGPTRIAEAEVDATIVEPKPRTRGASADGPGGLWSRAEAVWLDRTIDPLAQRLGEAGWAPWAEGAYCHLCGQAVGPGEVDAEGCAHCRGERRPWTRLVCLGEYRPPLDGLIREMKFQRMRRFGEQLGQMLGERVARCAVRAGLDGWRTVLVPVPVSRRRRMERGIDHALVLARSAAGACGGRVAPVLWRRHRPSQLEVAPSRREANAAGSMRPRAAWGSWLSRRLGMGDRWAPGAWGALAGRGPVLVVLVDDVTTTGATLRAAGRAVDRGCKRLGIKDLRIWAATVAATPAGGMGVSGDGGEVSVGGESRWERRVF